MSALAKLYYNSVKAGTRTIDQVPERYRAEVEEMLAADAYEAWELTEDFLNGKTIAELEAYMEAKGIDDAGCSVKAEYVARILEG